MVNPRPFLDLLTVTVELVGVRSVLRELIRLADQAAVLTDEQLQYRLLALAECAAPRSTPPHPIPGWPLVERGPRLDSRRPAGTARHCGQCAVRRQRAADPWRDAHALLSSARPG
ncbi:MAG: hypothetical protein ACRDRA_10595 [Pseudonocardiaceae bacterium]